VNIRLDLDKQQVVSQAIGWSVGKVRPAPLAPGCMASAPNFSDRIIK